MSESTSSEPRRNGIRPIDTAAFAAVWVFIFVILRIFAVSGYDWNTAFKVSTTLKVQDGVAMLVGSLMAAHLLTESLLVLVLPLLLAATIWGPRRYRPLVMLIVGLSTLLTVALVFSFGSWWLPLAIVIVFGILAMTRRLPTANLFRRAAVVAPANVGWFGAAGMLVIAALVTTPWAPQEVIETTDGSVTGHVLSVDSGYLNILTSQQKFVIVLTADVLSRD